MSKKPKCAMCGQSPFATTQRDAAQARVEDAQRDVRVSEATTALWQKRAEGAEARLVELVDVLEAIELASPGVGGEKEEHWTLRRWLDAHELFNSDISGLYLPRIAARAAIARARGTK